MNELTYDICHIITTVIALSIAWYVIPMVKRTITRMEDESLRDFIVRCVHAAEQIIKTGGEDKFAYVEKLVLDWLNDHNVKITQEQLKMLIESAVRTMKSETR